MKQMGYKVFFYLFMLCNSLYAQRVISGYVLESGSQEHLPGVVCYSEGHNIATETNAYGFFSLQLPRTDSIPITFQFVGYRAQTLWITAKTPARINVLLIPAGQLQEVIVEAKAESITQSPQMSKIDIPVSQIKDIPALLGEKDVLKVIQLLPGVQKSGEGNNGIYVRGGGPDQNLIILDDATLYNVSHLFGFFSLFNGDALKSIELTKGGFPARYGGRLSSVLDIQMKDGHKEQFHGDAGIGIISSRINIEGPLIKNKSSFLVSARRTYLDALVYPFLPDYAKGGYFFYDLNAKIDFRINDRDRLFISSYMGNDRFYFNFKDTDTRSENFNSLQWGNKTLTLRWNHVVNPKLFVNTSFIFSDYTYDVRSTFSEPTSTFSLKYLSGIRDYGFKLSGDYMPLAEHHIKFGIQGTYHQFTPEAITIKGNTLDEINQTNLLEAMESGIYFEDDWTVSPEFRVLLGFRESSYQLKNTWIINPEPRISARYLLDNEWALKLSFARMNQYLHLLSNSGIGLPTDLWVPATPKAAYMSSDQLAAGVSRSVYKNLIECSIEGYYKRLQNVLAYKDGASFFSDVIGSFNNSTSSWQDKVTSGNGSSYGAEFLIRKSQGRFNGWIGYTLSWTQFVFKDLNFGKPFYPRYDRRHDISVVSIFKFNEAMKLSATWVYGTGNAITLPLSSFDPSQYAAYGSAAGGVNQSLSYWGIQDYGQQRNAHRMGAYHRLDIGLQISKTLKHAVRTLELSVYNMYNRYNPFFYYIEGQQDGSDKLMQVSLFPLIPSISCSWRF